MTRAWSRWSGRGKTQPEADWLVTVKLPVNGYGAARDTALPAI